MGPDGGRESEDGGGGGGGIWCQLAEYANVGGTYSNFTVAPADTPSQP